MTAIDGLLRQIRERQYRVLLRGKKRVLTLSIQLAAAGNWPDLVARVAEVRLDFDRELARLQEQLGPRVPPLPPEKT